MKSLAFLLVLTSLMTSCVPEKIKKEPKVYYVPEVIAPGSEYYSEAYQAPSPGFQTQR